MTTATKKRTPRYITRKELLERVALCVDTTRSATVEGLGDGVDPEVRCQSVLWVYGYLTGMEMAHLVYQTQNHQMVEGMVDNALAAGIDEYRDLLRHSRERHRYRRTIKTLRKLMQRLRGQLALNADGKPQLRLLSGAKQG
jgi:hypothetical protein